jgi:anti-anti-sigma factor
LISRGQFAVLHIKGDVTAASEASIAMAYSSAHETGANRILFKFDKDAYINSGGIAILIQALAKARKNKQTIGIVGLSGHFKKIFGMVGITKFADLFDTVDDAINTMHYD